MSEDLLARATALRMDAVQHLGLLAGDATMCALGRSGRSFPAAKYHEGRQAAAGQVRSALRHGTSPGDALAEAAASWRQMLATLGATGADWAAYASGGVDAIEELALAEQPGRPQR